MIAGLIGAWNKGNPRAVVVPSGSPGKGTSVASISLPSAHHGGVATASATVRKPSDSFSWTSVDPATALAGSIGAVPIPKPVEIPLSEGLFATSTVTTGFSWPARPALQPRSRVPTGTSSARDGSSSPAQAMLESTGPLHPAWGPFPAMQSSLSSSAMRTKQASYVLGAGPKPLPYLSDQDALDIARDTARHHLAASLERTDGSVTGSRRSLLRGNSSRPISRNSAAPLLHADAAEWIPVNPSDLIADFIQSGQLAPLIESGDAVQLFDQVYAAGYDFAYGFASKAAAATTDTITAHAIASKQAHVYALSVVNALNTRGTASSPSKPSGARAATTGHVYKASEGPLGGAQLTKPFIAAAAHDSDASKPGEVITAVGDADAVLFQLSAHDTTFEKGLSGSSPLHKAEPRVSVERKPTEKPAQVDLAEGYLTTLRKSQAATYDISQRTVVAGDDAAVRGRQAGSSKGHGALGVLAHVIIMVACQRFRYCSIRLQAWCTPQRGHGRHTNHAAW